MSAIPEQVSALNASTLDAAVQLARISLDTTERLIKLGIDASREAANEAAKISQPSGEVTSLQDILTAQSKTAEGGVEKVVTLSKAFYEVAQQAQQEFTSVLEAKMAEFNKAFTASLDQALKSAPAGSEAAVAALKSTVAASVAAFQNVSSAAKQAARVAEANVHAVVESASQRAKPGKSK